MPEPYGLLKDGVASKHPPHENPLRFPTEV